MRRLTAALLALLLLAGCGSQGEIEQEELDWGAYQEELPEEEPSQEPAPYRPSAFTLAYHKDHTLDPITCGEGIQQDVAALLYEPLFRLNPAFEPEPVLCESWEWDESGLICTLTLRQDALFQGGASLTAKDVAETLQRAAASERYAYRLRNVSSVAANRAGQVVITLLEPNWSLPALLDIPIVKSGTADQLVPVGTGPYLFVSENGAEYLAADPGWWQQKKLPVEKISLIHAKDRATAMYLFSSHRAELLTVDPTDDLTAVAGQYETVYQPTTVLQFIGFNAAKGVFASAEVRSAFSRAIPRQTLAEVQMAGLGTAAQFPISPLSPLYPAALETVYNRDESLAALAALAVPPAETEEAGEAESPSSLVLLVNEEDAFRMTSARFIADSLSPAGGWKIEVHALPWEEYLTALAEGAFDLYFGEVRLTADWDLRDLLGTGGPVNYGGYSDETTDALLQGFATGVDREGNVRMLASRLLEEAPIAPVCFKNYTVLTHPGVVEGLSPAPSWTFYQLELWNIHLSE